MMAAHLSESESEIVEETTGALPSLDIGGESEEEYPEFTLDELMEEVEEKLVEMTAPREQGKRGKDKQERKRRCPIAGFTRGPYKKEGRKKYTMKQPRRARGPYRKERPEGWVPLPVEFEKNLGKGVSCRGILYFHLF